MRRSLVALVIGLALLGPAAARCEEAREAGALVLTLDEALRLAAERGWDVRKAVEYRAQVEGRYVAERSVALPQFTASSGASRSDDASQGAIGFPQRTENLAARLAVTQPLFTWGQIGAALKIADIGRQTAGDRLASARGTALKDAATAFFDLLLAREFEALALQNLQQRTRHLEEARRRLAAGTATDFDVLAASVDVQNARPEVIRTANRVGAAREALAFAIGIGRKPVEAAGSLESMAVAAAAQPDYATAFRTAAASRPELAELRKQRAMSSEYERVVRAGNKPRVDFGADYGWRSVDMDGSQGDGTTWSAGVQLTWPVFDGGRTQGAVAQAESDTRNLGIDEARFLDSLALETRTGIDAVRDAAAIVEALGGTVGEAERVLAMAEKGFELGVKTRLDVDDALLNLLQARASLARGRRDLLVAQINLRWVMGQLVAR